MAAESGISKQIRSYLKLRGIFAWRNNSGMLPNPRGRPVKFGFPGSSDILGVLPGGRFLGIEVKDPKGTTSKARAILQQAFRDEINAAGGVAFVATSIEDVQAEFERRAALKGS